MVTVLANTLVVCLIWVLESERLLRHTSTKLVLYDRIELIVPQRRQELIADLENRIGLKVENLEIGHVDFLRDAAFIKVFYTLDKDQTGSIDTLTQAKDFVELGAGYTFISKKYSSDIWKPRHRLYGDMTFSYRTGNWHFSLKERLQLTHMDVNNRFQKVPNALELKSRVKASYKASTAFTPYAYVELRTRFNDPSCTATWNQSTLSYSDYSFTGYKDTYFNRFRGAIGTEYKITRQHELDFFLLTDYCYEKDIDTNAEGTKLKSLTFERDLNIGIGISYIFKF